MKKLLSVLFFTVSCFAAYPQSILAGITNAGGSGGVGATYVYNTATGNDSLLFNFTNGGRSFLLGNPYYNKLIQATDGRLYGMAYSGGSYNQGGLFSYNPVTGKDSILYSFNGQYGYPMGSVIQASNGLLYGMVYAESGMIFSYNIVTGKDSIIMAFNNSTGQNPAGSLMQASNGLLYGYTTLGGSYGYGTLFSLDPTNNNFQVLVNFSNTMGNSPPGTLIQATDGNLYGVSPNGGANGYGALFCYIISRAKDTTLVDFNYNYSPQPYSSLLQASDGYLYAIAGGGVVFRYDITNHTGTVLTLNESNLFSYSSFIQATNGLLYAMFYSNPANPQGGVFRFNPITLQDSLVFAFNGANGSTPKGNLYQTNDGYIYGMTPSGGANGAGVLFRLDPATNQDSVLAAFDVNSVYNINAPTLDDSNGLIYGLTSYGGTHDGGTLFSYNPTTGKDTVLVNFSQYGNPNGSLTIGKDGLLWGTSSDSGAEIFTIDPATGKDSVRLNLFNANYYELLNPAGALLQAPNGLFYGTVQTGNIYNGCLYSYNPITNTDTILATFANGASPYCNLSLVGNIIYGSTLGAGQYGYGTLYSYNILTGVFTTLLDMTVNYANPVGSLIVDTANHLIYFSSVSTNNALLSFNYVTQVVTPLVTINPINSYNGINATGTLLWDNTTGIIYGTTYLGGTSNYGVLYAYNTYTRQDSILFNFNAIGSTQRTMQGNNGAIGVNPSGIMFLKHNLVSSVDKVTNNKACIGVYPNPTNDILNIQMPQPIDGTLSISNVLGQEVYEGKMAGNSSLTQVSIGSLPQGIYLLKIESNNQTVVKKIVKL